MSEMQAIIEYCIELHKFINVDLFQRGFYQIRLTHKLASKLVHKIEVNFGRSPDYSDNQNCNATMTDHNPGEHSKPSTKTSIVFPHCIVNGSAVSKTFQILYKSEEISLNDVISFKTHLIVDANRCVEQICKIAFILDVELWFTDQSFGPDHHNSIECVSQRQLILHFDVGRGLHYHLPVLFDYFHLSAITLSVHASLITLCLPYLSRSKYKSDRPNKDSQGSPSFSGSHYYGYDVLLFGCPISALNMSQVKNGEDLLALRIRRAQLVHWQLCSILFTAIQNLKRKLDEYIHLLPPWQKIKCRGSDFNPTFDNLSSLAQLCYKSCSEKRSSNASNTNFLAFQNESSKSEGNTFDSKFKFVNFKPEDFIASVESDMAYLCGSLIVQWQHFLKIVLHSEKIAQHLAKVHHLLRIRRFAEGFFAIEKQRRHAYSVCDTSVCVFNEITDSLRRSAYLGLLPHCDVECVSLDGDINSLPIIYEEKFDQDVSHNERGFTASLSDITLEDGFNNSLRESDFDATYPLKKNLREKLLNNFTRFNMSGRTKEEYYPNTSHFSGTQANVDKNTTTPSVNNSIGCTVKNSVTLLGFRTFDANREPRDVRDNHANTISEGCSVIPSGKSLHNINPEISRKLASSESLPDLNVKCKLANDGKNQKSLKAGTKTAPHVAKKKMHVKPPVDFQDKRKCLDEPANPESEFQGTAYFPKPPAQFLESKPNDIQEINKSTGKSETVNIDNDEDDDDDLTPTQELLSSDDTQPSTPTGSYKNPEFIQKKLDVKCTVLEMLKANDCLLCGKDSCDCENSGDDDAISLRRISAIGSDLVSFVKAKEEFRHDMSHKLKGWNIYSDFPSLASRIPYFQCDSDLRAFSELHLVVCVHGLDGNSADLRLVKTYLELGLPTTNLEFLMSQRNQGETFVNFETMTDRLVQEIIYHIEVYSLNPSKISFIGHSLGNIIIRAALLRPEMKAWLPKLHTFLSLSGPHLGTPYNSSGLVNMGLWFMQKWKKSGSLLQLAMKDSCDPRQTYLYKLSLNGGGLAHFRHLLLCGSSQDHYVPIHSSHIELCNASLNDTSINGIAYREMVTNILNPILCNKSSTKLIRYDVHHSLASNTNSLIGRAAHIAVLDSELFIEKFMVVTGLKYFA